MEIVLVLGGIAGFGLMWYLVCSAIKAMAGFHASPILAEQARCGHLRSGWSSVRCGWLRFNNCIKVVRVDDGYVVQLMWIFGGGYLAIPDVEIRQVEKTKLLWRTRVLVFTDARDFCFYGSAGACVWNGWKERPGEAAKDD